MTMISVAGAKPACPELLIGQDTSALKTGADRAIQAFIDPELRDRLRNEHAASAAGGSKVFRIGNSLRQLSEDFAFLAIAQKCGVAIPAPVWESIRENFLPILLSLDEVNFQGRNGNPPWKSDLYTADIGVGIALANHFANLTGDENQQLANFIRSKCIRPILMDWLDDDTRVHSLDSMGHNWWSVIVGGAGVMATLLADQPLSERIAEKLREWFSYPGNEFSRKRPNFGPQGDYVEGFAYGEYGLINPFIFAHLNPGFRVIPDALTLEQAKGLAGWFKHAFIRTRDGFCPQRFGDIHHHYQPHAAVWHTLARLVGDDDLLRLAHDIKPAAHSAADCLMWTPRPSALNADFKTAALEAARLEVFPTSGLAFLDRNGQRLSVRAGEFWNHNHLDAGSFIYHQDDIRWIDDSGTCAYSRAEYVDYYITPQAHNVAFAPALVPPIRRAQYEGLPHIGRFLTGAHNEHVAVLCADTGVVSGGALQRSYRWFLQLSDEATIIWDDLAAHQEQRFSMLLHTECDATRDSDSHVILKQDDRLCHLYVFSDLATEASISQVKMGQRSTGSEKVVSDFEGRLLAWQTVPGIRTKFGTAIGTQLQSVTWAQLENESGWECNVTTGGSSWRIWFNPLADGRIMHQNCISRWREFETDAYALIQRQSTGHQSLMAIEASFVRANNVVLQSHLARRSMFTIEL